MFYYSSIIGVTALTLHSVVFIYRHRKKLTCMAGMMMAMTLGMMVSLAFGTILAVLMHDFTLSTIVSVLIGMLTGYWTGRAVSLMASVDGMLAGVMGGMMGAMLGAMTTKPVTIVAFIDVIFLFIVLVLNQLISEETRRKQILSRIGNDSFITIVLGIALVGFLFYLE